VIVVVTREAGENDQLRRWIGDVATVIEVPVTTTRYREYAEVESELRALDQYGEFRSLVVTSARTSQYVDFAQAALGAHAEIFSVGPSTSEALALRGVAVSREAPLRAMELAELISAGPVLELGARGMRDELMQELVARGLFVARVACYETEPVALSETDRSAIGTAHVVVIAAPSAWSVARSLVAASTWVVVPGPTTFDAVRAEHERVRQGWGPDLRVVLASLDESGPRSQKR
jgi:uroporphyrinogen-III synthase